MRKTLSHQKRQGALSRLGTAAVLIVVSSPFAASTEGNALTRVGAREMPEVAAETALRDAQRSSSAFVPEFFDGGGSGPTPETAVQAAIDDARNTASGYGLFTCELVDEPAVFPQPPNAHRAFSAQVRMRCTQ